VVDEQPVGALLEVETTHHNYLLKNRGNGKVLVSGHPDYCPEPILMNFHGATDNTHISRCGSLTWMHMQFGHLTLGVMRTSRVREIREQKTLAHET
jgi:hypothetical protein